MQLFFSKGISISKTTTNAKKCIFLPSVLCIGHSSSKKCIQVEILYSALPQKYNTFQCKNKSSCDTFFPLPCLMMQPARPITHSNDAQTVEERESFCLLRALHTKECTLRKVPRELFYQMHYLFEERFQFLLSIAEFPNGNKYFFAD